MEENSLSFLKNLSELNLIQTLTKMFMIYAAFFLILLYAYYRYAIKDLVVIDEMFPGPLAVPFFGNALMMLRSSKDLYEKFQGMCIFYRRSFRLWIGTKAFIVTFNADDAEIILGSTTQLQKAENYQFLLPWIGDGLLVSIGQKWRKHRKILTPAFHFKILERFINIFNENGNILCEELSLHADGKVFDISPFIKLYALDNICETAMGTSIHAQKKPNSSYVRAIKDMCTVIFRRSLTIWLRPNWLFNMSKYGNMQREALRVIHGTTIDVIQKRKLEMKQDREAGNEIQDANPHDLNIKRRLAFLDILLNSAEESGMTDKEIQEEVDTFMFEGHDTITSALSFAIYNLAKHSDIQVKAFQEQLKIFGKDDRSSTFQDLQDMKYLEQVIKESLRLYPSVPMIGRVVTEDIVLDPAIYIPKGSQVLVTISGIHRHPQHWEKPFEFYPEHFNTEAVQKRHPFAFIPFSAGQRNCIGQKYAILEMKSCLSKLLRQFEILVSSTPEDEPILLSELILNSQNGIKIRLRPRKYEEI